MGQNAGMSAGAFGPVRDDSGRVLDQIRLLGVTARGRHGVLAQERLDGQDFRVDAVLHVDIAKAAATDDLAATVDYGALATRLADAVRADPVDLIETLAERLAAVCLENELVTTVDITLHKPSAPIAEQFADVQIAIRRRRDRVRATDAVLALGTNLGDRLGTLRGAVDDLAGTEGVTVRATSPVFETRPVGGPDQPDYYNAVVLVSTTLEPLELLRAGQAVEARHGRERIVRWGPRTLDVDIIRYGDRISADPVLELPHPRAAGRAFVLAPWLAVDPGAWLPAPGGARLSVRELLDGAADKNDVRLIDIQGDTT
jgi:2-amino-4-hydroxy-6-hydroxymethyldihydropteridine diphosphokinase/dihydroneopterin aldolase